MIARFSSLAPSANKSLGASFFFSARALLVNRPLSVGLRLLVCWAFLIAADLVLADFHIVLGCGMPPPKRASAAGFRPYGKMPGSLIEDGLPISLQFQSSPEHTSLVHPREDIPQSMYS